MPRIHPMCDAMATASHRFLTSFPTEFAKAVAAIHHPTPSTLPPCHKCGGEPMLRVEEHGEKLHYIQCHDCGLKTNRYMWQYKVVKEWCKMCEPTAVGASEPGAGVKTLQLEYGKRYLRRNGEVSGELITTPTLNEYVTTHPFWDADYGLSYRSDGSYIDDLQPDVFDLVSEYIESQPAESPEDWVMITDPDHIARPCDECCCNRIGYEWAPCLGFIGLRIRPFGNWKFRCRRRDLPVVPGKLEKTIHVVKDIAEVGILPADKPRMRQVTLREYRNTGKNTAWSSSDWLIEARLTGRTCVTEVPE